jgi:HAMP domain-containing protein
MSQALAKAGVAFEKKNPVTSLMSDVATGMLREDILGEKILSAILEIKVPVERTEEVIRLVQEVEKQVDTVIALGVGTRCDEEGEENVVAPILERMGYKLERAKTNVGLGRITNPVEEPKKEEPVGSTR